MLAFEKHLSQSKRRRIRTGSIRSCARPWQLHRLPTVTTTVSSRLTRLHCSTLPTRIPGRSSTTWNLPVFRRKSRMNSERRRFHVVDADVFIMQCPHNFHGDPAACARRRGGGWAACDRYTLLVVLSNTRRYSKSISLHVQSTPMY